MFPKQGFHWLTLLISLAFLTLLGLCWKDCDYSSLAADPPKTQPDSAVNVPKVTVYDADPQHLWNRLYAALYVRTSADGKTYGEDGLDPLLWPSSIVCVGIVMTCASLGWIPRGAGL